MEQELTIPVNHDDFIHDLAYNFYATRLASCSSDRSIKIWDWNKQSGSWILKETLFGHDSAVIRLSWAHPEFGQVLASCSLDRSVKIWMELDSAKTGNRTWDNAVHSLPHSSAVHSIAFAPEYKNLTLAAGCSDGKVRFYSPADAIGLTNWEVDNLIDFVPERATDSDGPLCLSWCKSRFTAPHMIVVGGSKGNKIRIYNVLPNNCLELLELDQYEDAVLDIDWAPSMGRSYHLIATACSDGHIRIYKFWSDPPTSTKGALADSLFVRDGDQQEYTDGKNIAAGGAAATKTNGSARYGHSIDDDGAADSDEGDGDADAENDNDDDDDDDGDDDDEDDGDDEDGDKDSDDSDNDVDTDDAYSDNRSGGGSSDGAHARTRRSQKSRMPKTTHDALKSFKPHAELVSDLVVEPLMPVRRVRWNGTGTLLASSSDDGVTRLWKMTVNGTWREVAAVTAEKSPAVM
ncbi:epoxide hydrolase, soluble (sEH) [Coemansia thaxteri]|nr:epoxide hydrolase, soluble (sEH) [Coemansia thaxteri]